MATATFPLEHCPVYSCTLSAELHDPVDPESGFDCAPNSFWHSNEHNGVCWPAPLEEEPEPPRGPLPLYSAAEENDQRRRRALGMEWVRSSWHATLEDMIFEATMMRSPAPFSGDHRPTKQREEQSDGS